MRPWINVLCIGAAGSLAILVAGPELRTLIALPLLVAALVTVWHRTSRLPPKARHAFTYFCAAGTVSLLGAVTRFIHGEITGAVDPLPSPADAVFVVAYILFILGGIRFYRYRVNEPEQDGWLDASIVAAAVGFLVWDILLIPYIRDQSIIPTERAMNGLYSVLSLTLLAVTVRIISSPGRRAISYYLFGAAVCCFFLTDLLSTLQYARGWSDDLGLLMTLPVYTLFGAAVYHPTAGELTELQPDREPSISIQRIAGLAAALVVAPILMARQLTLPDRTEFAPLIVVAGFVMAVLVTYRLYRLVTDREQMTQHAQSLQSVGEELVAATDIREIYGLVVTAALDVDSKAISGASLFVNTAGNGHLECVASHGDAPRDWDLARALDAHLHAGSERREGWSAGLHVLRLDVEPESVLLVQTSIDLDRFKRRYLTTLGKTAALAVQAHLAREQLAEDRGKRRLDALVQNSGDLVLVAADEFSEFDYISPAARVLLESAAPEPPPQTIAALLHPEDKTDFLATCGALPPGSQTPSRDLRIGPGNGTWVWFDIVATNLSDDPEVGGLVINGRDASERRAAQQSMLESEARFRALVQNSADVVAIVDSGRIRYASPSVQRVLGYEPSQLSGKSVESIVLDADRHLLVESLSQIRPTAVLTTELRVRTSKGNYLTMEALLTDLRDEPAVNGIVVNARDITVPRELESKLRQAAYFDQLTGMPNRAYLEERLSQATRAARGEPFHVAVLIVDLDDFKDVNDGFGREAGDAVLRTVARRLQEHTRVRDLAIRIGGDEFAILVSECYGDFELEELSARLLDALGSPMVIGEQSVSISVSIGIASNGGPRTGDEDLLRDADAAMYLAKEQGKNRAELFKDSRRQEAAERVELTNDMRIGLQRGEFILAYQPIVDLTSRRIIGAEVLARWKHPRRGTVMPGVFIPLAEQNGLISQLGRFVLRAACEQLSRWGSADAGLRDLTLSVNLSTQQMRDPNVVEYVQTVIRESGSRPGNLTLEVTESLLAQDTHVMLDRLEQLKRLGVSLAIDDFGTGYSSLAYLQQYPFDILKVDQSFVAQLDSDPGPASAVVRTIVDLAHQLGAVTVAEGIETDETFGTVAGLGCLRGQGYFFGRPTTVEDLESAVLGSDAPVGVV